MDPGFQAQQEFVLQLQLREMQERNQHYEIKQQRQDAREAAIRDYFFAQKFNKLINKLKEFTNHYNEGTVDAKTVAELKKAWRSLEKDDGWFHEPDSKDKKKNQDNDKNTPKQAKVQACGSS
jgi:hypothetical protein